MTLLSVFKVYPGKNHPLIAKDRYFYNVHVFDDVESQLSKGARLLSHSDDPTAVFGAITIPRWRMRQNETGEWYYVPNIGDVLFCTHQLGTETICHESVHIATDYLRLLGKLQLTDCIDMGEEILAYAVGQTMSQIVASLYKRKIL